MTRYVLAALTLAVAGCQSLPQAALMYTSKTVGGLDVSSPRTNDGQVSISIGYKRDDFAYVPVAVCAKKEAGDDKEKCVVQFLNGSEGHRNADLAIKATDTPEEKERKDRLRAALKDAQSVFGSFEGRGLIESGSNQKVDAKAGNIFATGVAAQKVSNSIASRSTTACLQALLSVAELDANQKLKDQSLLKLCGE